MAGLKVGEVARQAGVNQQTIRYYERRGLLPEPPRTEANYRVYPAQAVLRVRFIKRAQQLGFTLTEITELLSLRAAGRSGCADVRSRAEAKVKDITARVQTLQAMRKALDKLIGECSGSGPVSECPILEALDSEGLESRRPRGTHRKGRVMVTKRKIELFSAKCPLCDEAVELVKRIACPSCEVTVLDMNQPDIAARAKSLGIRSLPAVVIDGRLADCCAGRGPEEQTLRKAGVGSPI